MHLGSHQLRIEKSSKILQSIAEELRGQYRLLCLDEFQVVDIADAMILRGLLDALFRANITLMVTSNRPPSDLYLNGIQRASFVPCIELIQRRLEVMEVQAQQDYRLLSTGVDGAMPYYFQYAICTF
jgi:predicted ATPase